MNPPQKLTPPESGRLEPARNHSASAPAGRAAT